MKTLLLIPVAVLLASCQSAPDFPAPKSDSGQILVRLNGAERDGVTGPKSEVVQADYGSERVSVEEGKAFQRVDYNEIQDVVVVIESDQPLGKSTRTNRETLTVGRDFSNAQLVLTANAPVLEIVNERDSSVTLYSANADGEGFDVTIGAGETATVRDITTGRFEIFCDEDEDLYCVLIVPDVPHARVQRVTSDEPAFFDGLPSGEYRVHVYAPRLPVEEKTVRVTHGKRATVDVALTVNDLPEAP